MKTRKKLVDMIPELLVHFNNNKSHLQFNYRIFNVLQGQLKPEVEQSLRKEIISQSALNRCLQRIPSINIIKRVADKLSKVYTDKPTRIADSEGDDIAIMDVIAKTSEIDGVMVEANKLYNSVNSFALEPYVQDGKQKIRVLTNHQFLPYSDSITNPNEMTVFMKFMGKRKKVIGSDFDENGRQLSDRLETLVDIITLYSDDEILVIDADGNVRSDVMGEMGMTSTKNPFARIPVLYKSRSKLQLIPYPNIEGLDMSILIPKLLTDLNYSAQFMSHSIIWTKNTDLAAASLNPDAVVNLGRADLDGHDPEMGTVDPKVNISENLRLIQFQAEGYFEDRGIKSKSAGMNANNPESGIAKAVDEGDVTAEKKVQTEFFRCVESELWDLIADMQNVWSNNNIVDEKRSFTKDFSSSFRIEYAEMRVAKTQRQKLEEIGLMRDQRLITRKQALAELRPQLTDTQIDDWVVELEKEDQELMDNAINEAVGISGGRNSNGQFSEGNTEAKDDPDIVINREEKKVNGK